MSTEEITRLAMSLPLAERVELAEAIWDSILVEEARNDIVDTTDDAPITTAQRAELERRVAAFEADPKAGSTWEEVEAHCRTARKRDAELASGAVVGRSHEQVTEAARRALERG